MLVNLTSKKIIWFKKSYQPVHYNFISTTLPTFPKWWLRTFYIWITIYTRFGLLKWLKNFTIDLYYIHIYIYIYYSSKSASNVYYLFFTAEPTNHSISKFHFMIFLIFVVTQITRIQLTTTWKPLRRVQFQ